MSITMQCRPTNHNKVLDNQLCPYEMNKTLMIKTEINPRTEIYSILTWLIEKTLLHSVTINASNFIQGSCNIVFPH
jgi:hypothetical protein